MTSIAAGGVPAVVCVIIIVIVDASLSASPIPHRQNGNYSRGRANGRFLNHNAIGNGAPLVNDASGSREACDERRDKKNGFHGLSRCSMGMLRQNTARLSQGALPSTDSISFGRFFLDVMPAMGD